jgi:integrase/recombinase XerD
MSRKRHRQTEPIAGDLSDPQGMGYLLKQFLDWLSVCNYASETVRRRRSQLNPFVGWAEERSLTRVTQITRPVLLRYQRHLFHQLDRYGRPMSFRNQYHRLMALRSWCKWLLRNSHLLHNPANDLEMPKLGDCLPKHVLSERETEEVLNQANVSTLLGLRDRAILETLYSTGIRRRELINLQLFDVDAERGALTVRQGKGKKDRVVPIGDRALAWTRKYCQNVRPQLVSNPRETTLYLTRYGRPFSGNTLSWVVREYVLKADLGKSGSCHLFRHTMATLMLENGADIRFIQAMLGHVNLKTTQIYTRVSIRKLKEVHDATHPARLKPRAAADQQNGNADQQSGHADQQSRNADQQSGAAERQRDSSPEGLQSCDGESRDGVE